MTLKLKKIGDGLVWRCKSLKCNKKEVTVRKNSPMYGLKTPLKKIIEIIYEWSINTKIKDIKRETKVDYASINTVFWLIRKKIEKTDFKNRRPVCIIEIDETAVTKRKFERGRLISTLWCVGGVFRAHKIKSSSLNLRW